MQQGDKQQEAIAMKRKISTYGLALLAGLFLLLGFYGCMPHKVYRSPNNSIVTNIQDLMTDEGIQAEVESHCVESHDQFSLAFVEFDDQGDFWSRDQLVALQQMLQEESNRDDTDGLIIVTFVHGWKHNAQVCDENVSCFREVLNGIANVESLRAIRSFNSGGSDVPRRVVGVYVGWRGLSITTPIIKETSFYARKAAAHRVGGGEVIELVTRLELWRDSLNGRENVVNTSRLITVGHSFGAAVTYGAVSKVLHERLAESTLSNQQSLKVSGFGDLVVLVNPAFEASIYAGIHNIAANRASFPNEQRPVLAVVSSETDTATGVAFPIGRFFSTMFEKTSSDAQKKALRTTLGNYEPYRTHDANVASQEARSTLLPDIIELDEAVDRGPADCRCSYINVDSMTFSDLQQLADLEESNFFIIDSDRARYGDVELTSTGNGGAPENPFYVIGATDEIVTKHNGIYNRVFLDFLRYFILASDQ